MNRYEYEALAEGFPGLTRRVGYALWHERPEVPALCKTPEYFDEIFELLEWVSNNLGIDELIMGTRFYEGW